MNAVHYSKLLKRYLIDHRFTVEFEVLFRKASNAKVNIEDSLPVKELMRMKIDCKRFVRARLLSDWASRSTPLYV
jgi:hypothetical protein